MLNEIKMLAVFASSSNSFEIYHHLFKPTHTHTEQFEYLCTYINDNWIYRKLANTCCS